MADTISIDNITKSIKAILKDGDLDLLSAKKIRRMLEAEYKADFTSRKEEIDKLVMELITSNENEEEQQEKKADKGEVAKQEPANGSLKPEPDSPKDSSGKKEMDEEDADGEEGDDDDADDDDDSGLSDIEEEVPKKKARVQSSSSTSKKPTKKVKEDLEDEPDAEVGRPRRSCKAQPIARKPRKPRPKGEKGNSLYSRPCALLPPLASVLDTDRLPRPEIVKRLWEIVKERDLLDPKNKQFMLCDQQMQELFGKRRVRMFGVMKHLKSYIKDLPRD